MEIKYVKLLRIYNILKKLNGRGSKNQLAIKFNRDTIEFKVRTKDTKLDYSIDIAEQSEYEKEITLNLLEFLAAVEKYGENKALSCDYINVTITKDRLNMVGNTHNGVLSVITMDYEEKHLIESQLDCQEQDPIDPIEKRIHGADEWEVEELSYILDTASKLRSKVYIASTLQKVFMVNGNEVVDIDVNEYLGNNLIIGQKETRTLSKMLEDTAVDKLYLNIKTINNGKKKVEQLIDIQSIEGNIKIQIKNNQADREELELYNELTQRTYKTMQLTLIKQWILEPLYNLMLSSNTEYHLIEIQEDRMIIREIPLSIYNIAVNQTGETTNSIMVNLKNLYNAIECCQSDFVALDISDLEEQLLRVAELDLGKYDDTYSRLEGNIGQFELRDRLNLEEQLELREKSLGKKIYISI